MELTGRCICGAVRYRISEGPLVARSCSEVFKLLVA